MHHPTTAKKIGNYIVMDPKICHGEPTFRGTRVLVRDVLDQVGDGMSWDAIVAEWRGSVRKVAIAEAIQLTSDPLLAHTDDMFAELITK